MPANLDNMDTEMDQDMGAETPDIGAEEPITDHGDQEGAMAKQELIKLASYATSLQDHISDDEQLEAWVQAKLLWLLLTLLVFITIWLTKRKLVSIVIS